MIQDAMLTSCQELPMTGTKFCVDNKPLWHKVNKNKAWYCEKGTPAVDNVEVFQGNNKRQRTKKTSLNVLCSFTDPKQMKFRTPGR
mmetsp:Transcript_5249/g.12536  ORF Transcript_5249/g.12536 Transcript_5249/m.12536 type:complete len:86 (-) Transcript_5249:333-590(-)